MSIISLLKYFRKVILQDACLLFTECPSAFFFKHPVFSDPEFLTFKQELLEKLDGRSSLGQYKTREDMLNAPNLVSCTRRDDLTDVMKSDARSLHDLIHEMSHEFNAQKEEMLKTSIYLSELAETTSKSILQLTVVFNDRLERTEKIMLHNLQINHNLNTEIHRAVIDILRNWMTCTVLWFLVVNVWIAVLLIFTTIALTVELAIAIAMVMAMAMAMAMVMVMVMVMVTRQVSIDERSLIPNRATTQQRSFMVLVL